MPNCRDIVKHYLAENGYDGLFIAGCGCGLDDFAPCGDGPYPDCEPARRVQLGPDEYIEDAGPGDWVYAPAFQNGDAWEVK